MSPVQTRISLPRCFDTLGSVILWCGGCPMPCRTLSSTSCLYCDVSRTTFSYSRCDKNVSRLGLMSLDRPWLRSKKIKYIQVFYLPCCRNWHASGGSDSTILIIFFLLIQYIFEYTLLVTDSNNTEVYILSRENPWCSFHPLSLSSVRLLLVCFPWIFFFLSIDFRHLHLDPG